MNALVPIDKAKRLVDEFSSDIKIALPSNIPFERFRSAFITAVANSPDILQCEPQSIRTALMKSAADNLMPDGREAAIVKYNTKVQRDGREVWLNLAQYMPMVQGIRKRAFELSDVRIRAEVIHANDFFDSERGDTPFLKHKDAPLNQSRGDMIGAYAIFEDSNNRIVHREIMRKEDIDAVRAISKSANGPAWARFGNEMARKVVLRRGAKSVPALPDDLRRVIEHEDEPIDFSALPTREEHEANPLIEHSEQETFTIDAEGVIQEPEYAYRQPPIESAIGVIITSGPLTPEEPPEPAVPNTRDTDRQLLEGFSAALGDATDAAGVKVKSAEYWAKNGGKPEPAHAIYASAKSIYAIHLDALSGKLTAEECEAMIRRELG